MGKHIWYDERLAEIDFKTCTNCDIRCPLASPLGTWPAVRDSECVAAKDAPELPVKLDYVTAGGVNTAIDLPCRIVVNQLIDYLQHAKEKDA